MKSIVTNIFASIPDVLPEELFTSLLKRDNVHIERIVSQGHSSPLDQWYDQAWDEWLMVLEGQAVLVYEQDLFRISMMAGDTVLIPAHTKHRVEWTAANIHTVWLAVHLYK